MSFGELVAPPISWDPVESPTSTHLYQVALQWLKDDRTQRRELEKAGKKMRGARKDQASTLITHSKVIH